MTTIAEIYRYLDEIAPFDTAADFDNVGLLVGDGDTPVSHVMISLDATSSVLKQAKQRGASLLITHHPIIFNPLRSLQSQSLPFRFLQEKVAVLSAHTNLDQAEGGVGDCLAAALELTEVAVFAGSEGMGRIGVLPTAMPVDQFAGFVAKKLHAPIRYTKTTHEIQTVAVLGGSGEFAWEAAKCAGADAFVTGESKHHLLLAAQEENFCFVDAGHYATEVVVCEPLARRLRERFSGLRVEVATQFSPVTGILEER